MHIATHGYFDPSSLFASYLILGNKSPWRISEINDDKQLFSDISLVVLSACETAVGLSPETVERRAADGREVSSVAQAFISAGANHVVASLWQVNDEATSVLMQQFYRELAASATPDIAKALRVAQQSVLTGKITAIEEASRSSIASPSGSTAGESTNQVKPAVIRYLDSWILSIFNLFGGKTVTGEQTNRSDVTPQLDGGVSIEPAAEVALDTGYAHPYYWAPFILIGNGL